MYETSSIFKDLATSDQRIDKAYVVIDGVTYDDSPDGRLDSVKFDYKTDSFIGGFNAASIIVELYYEGLSDLNWVGKEIEVFVGFEGTEYVPVGTFLIPNEDEGVSTDDSAQVVTLTAYDFAIDFDFQYEQVTLPATGRQIMIEVATRNGVDFDANCIDLIFDNYVFTEINVNENEKFSDRELVNQYAALNLAVGTINRDTELTFKSVFESNTAHFSVDGHNYQNIQVEAQEGPINSLVYEQGDVDDPVWVKDETSIDAFGLNEAKIKENVFISLMERSEQQIIIDTLFSIINGYEYTPFEIEGYDARPDIEPLDLIEVLDSSDVPHLSPIMNISWEYEGTLDGSLSSEVLPETLTDYSLSGTEKDLLNMGVKVNRIDKRITLEIKDVKTEIKEIELTPGPQGPQGPKGEPGKDGIQGPPGTNGQSQYIHIRYSENANGNPMVTTPNKYIGIANTTSSTAPTGYSSYTWSKFTGDDGAKGDTGSKGEQGVPGIKGQDGKDGKPTYTWVKYADTPTSGMSDYPDDKKYIGLAFNKDTATESTAYNQYEWSLMPQNISVGGRNYVQNSFEEKEFNKNYQGIPLYVDTIDKFIDETVTVSFEARLHEDDMSNGVVRVYFRGGSPTVYFSPDVTITGEWARYSRTMHITESVANSGNNQIAFHFGTNSVHGYVRNVKLEKGDTPTDWTPAPEDIEDELTELRNETTINTSNIEMLPDSIIDTVTQEFTSKGEYDEYKETLETRFEQTAKDFGFLFRRIEESISDLDDETQESFREYLKYIRFIDGEIHLGNNEENSIELQIKNNRISFMQQGNEVAYISNNRLYITDGRFLNSLRIGQFEFRPRANGSLSFGKVGN